VTVKKGGGSDDCLFPRVLIGDRKTLCKHTYVYVTTNIHSFLHSFIVEAEYLCAAIR
jgi:hypothetical protein